MLVREDTFIRFVFNSPILQVTVLTNRSPTDQEWAFAKHTMLDFYEAALCKGIRIAICFNLLQMGTLPIHRYQDWAALFKKNKDRTARCVEATCVVTGNALVRGAMNGFFLMYNPIRPFQMKADMNEAMAWLNERVLADNNKHTNNVP